MPDPKIPEHKDFDPSDKNPCKGCSNCCEYIAIGLDNPVTAKDFDAIYWYLLHKDVWVYIDEENDWYVQFNTVCDKLAKDGRCGIYPERPRVCRDYEAESCVRYGEGPPEKHLFRNDEDLMTYLAVKRPKALEKFKRYLKKKPALKKSR